jgi:hypothetical protein
VCDLQLVDGSNFNVQDVIFFFARDKDSSDDEEEDEVVEETLSVGKGVPSENIRFEQSVSCSSALSYGEKK